MTQTRQPATFIRPERGVAWPNFAVFWQRRDLIRAFVSRDIKVHYQQTVLGPLWLLVQPIVTTAILAGMVSRFVELPTQGIPASLFYFVAMIMWSYFSEVVLTVGQVYISNEFLFSKAAFPRIVLPVATAISNLIGLALQFALLVLLAINLAAFGDFSLVFANLWIILATLPFLIMLALGVGLIAASLTTRYRDVANALPFALQSAFLLTPIIYPFTLLPENWRLLIVTINPLSVIGHLWRMAIGGTSPLATPMEILFAAASCLATFLVGLTLFQTSQRLAADTI